MRKINNIEEFRTERDRLVREFGERLLSGSAEDNAAIRKAATPLARYGKMPVEKIVSVLTKRYIETT